ncbi:hypothetical protein DZ860_17065 [Vibrio sinensis]|uniref:Uncharacterized protein n=1 Tax=Vibrio sinensis TaxID=2302434 RepID=A0A3A6Q9Y3_9VIBR|nr:hypothetical protein [Vibrio sinensis]RJX68704.1 hypothetical protein DZ860_17065 [Vibrio sinensis]
MSNHNKLRNRTKKMKGRLPQRVKPHPLNALFTKAVVSIMGRMAQVESMSYFDIELPEPGRYCGTRAGLPNSETRYRYVDWCTQRNENGNFFVSCRDEAGHNQVLDSRGWASEKIMIGIQDRISRLEPSNAGQLRG